MEVISKRTIGKLIVKHCGNQGQADDPTLVVSLRRILQATITKLDTEPEETCRNAEIVIYDQLGNDFCIRLGDFESKFFVQLDEKDEINIMCTNRKKQSIFSCLGVLIKLTENSLNSPSSSAQRTAIIYRPTSDSDAGQSSVLWPNNWADWNSTRKIAQQGPS